MMRVQYLFIAAMVVVFCNTPALQADDSTIAHFRFEDDAEKSTLQFDSVSIEPADLGPLESPVTLKNSRAAKFNGTTSLLTTSLPGNTEGLVEGFTWEGFFFVSSDQKFETDGAVGDRFVSQFIGDAGTSTRLTIGLAAPKENAPPVLSVAFAGTSTRHDSSIEVIADVWHHFALIHEPGQPTAKLSWYLDHELAGQVELDGKSTRKTLPAAGSAPFAIGARLKQDGKADRGFAGMLDEIRISSRPLKINELLRVKQIQYDRQVVAHLYDRLPKNFDWNFEKLDPAEAILLEALSFTDLPPYLNERGYQVPRTGKQAIRAEQDFTLPEGRQTFLLRTLSDAMLLVDGEIVIDARRSKITHPLGELDRLPRDYDAEFASDGKPHRIALVAAYDASKKDATLGDVIVCLKQTDEKTWILPASSPSIELASTAWKQLQQRQLKYLRTIEGERKLAAIGRGNRKWDKRHEWAAKVASEWQVKAPASNGNLIDAFLAAEGDSKNQPIIGDEAFLRRVSLDLRGRIPTLDEMQRFRADRKSDKRERMIDEFLASEEWAHSWVGYWQDVLAENPSILKPTLNNSGPFRRWIRDSFARNLPMDRFAAELILMEGDNDEGGTAGFAEATANDSPMAMKAHVLAKAFLAVDMKCARCHDSPETFLEQRDLFSLAAMLHEKPLSIPKTSTVGMLPGGRQPLVTASLSAGDIVQPDWTLEEILPRPKETGESPVPDRLRGDLAEIITSPESPRFSDVIVNRVWKRYMGTAFVEPVDSWLHATPPLPPSLLRALSGWFVENGYDMKALARMITTSRAYQSAASEKNEDDTALFSMQSRRRMSAEQLVDSVHRAMGKELDAEELTFDPNETRGFLNLGLPSRAWQLTSMSNERDRPALAMPVNQSIVDVLKTFGWRENRPDPITDRDELPNPLQPLMIANGLMMNRVIRLTEESSTTELCLKEQTVEELVDSLFLTVVSRTPDATERAWFVELIGETFETRQTGKPKPKTVKRKRAYVDWDKHLEAEASLELMEAERIVREGDPPTVRLTSEFRERVEDGLWALFNSPEFLFVP